jgi:hypothetical protein
MMNSLLSEGFVLGELLPGMLQPSWLAGEETLGQSTGPRCRMRLIDSLQKREFACQTNLTAQAPMVFKLNSTLKFIQAKQ